MESKSKKASSHGHVPAPSGPAQPVGQTGGAAAELAALQAQVKKLTDIAGRAQAELQNAKVRMEKDAEDLRKFAAESIVLRLLPVVDNFQRAFQHLPDDLKAHDWVKGVAAIEQDFLRQMTELGLKKIEALGQKVDPNKHEVLMQEPGEAGVVTAVFGEGYELHGKVLRPAKVKVGDGTARPKPPPAVGGAEVNG